MRRTRRSRRCLGREEPSDETADPDPDPDPAPYPDAEGTADRGGCRDGRASGRRGWGGESYPLLLHERETPSPFAESDCLPEVRHGKQTLECLPWAIRARQAQPDD